VERRKFLVVGAGAVGGLSAATYFWLRAKSDALDPGTGPRGTPHPAAEPLVGEPFDAPALATLRRLLDDLLPHTESLPSATESKVDVFIVRAVALPGLGNLRNALLKLTRHLDLQGKADGLRYSNQPNEARAQILRSVAEGEEGRGAFRPKEALELTLRLALEGYLGHPDHGGNAGAAAWDALSIDMPRKRDPWGHH